MSLRPETCLLAYRSMYNARIMDLPLSSFVSHFFFADSTRCRFTVARCMASLQYICKQKSSVFSVVTGLIVEMILKLCFVCNAVLRAEIEA